MTVILANKILARGDQWGKGRALHLLGDAAHHTINYEHSQRFYEQSLVISRSIGDRWSEGDDLNMLGEVAYTLGDYPRAERLYREAVVLAEAIGDLNQRAWCLDRVGDVLTLQGRYAEARSIAMETLALGRELGSQIRIAYRLMALVEIATGEGDYSEALRNFEQAETAFSETDSDEGPAWLAITRCQIGVEMRDADTVEQYGRRGLEIFEMTGSPWGRSAALHYLGEAARMNGDYDRAWDYLQRAIRVAESCKSIMLLMRYLVGVGALLAETDQPERAVELLTLVQHHPATWDVSCKRAARLVDGLASKLPPDIVTAARSRGVSLVVDSVVTRLLASPSYDG
jgi:tetratricopeptide (TPR) repeat protein